jgi:hypothetical protein
LIFFFRDGYMVKITHALSIITIFAVIMYIWYTPRGSEKKAQIIWHLLRIWVSYLILTAIYDKFYDLNFAIVSCSFLWIVAPRSLGRGCNSPSCLNMQDIVLCKRTFQTRSTNKKEFMLQVYTSKLVSFLVLHARNLV